MQKQLQKAMDEFYTVTGLKLDPILLHSSHPSQTLEQIKTTLHAYKDKFSTQYILRMALEGKLDYIELKRYYKQLHIHPQKTYCLFLIRFKQKINETAEAILHGLFPSRHHAYIIPMDDINIALLYEIKGISPEKTAHLIVDTLASEAMCYVYTTYSKPFSDLKYLSQIHHNCLLSLNIGFIFYSDQSIIRYDKLGIGRLIYALPISACENFLEESLGEQQTLIYDHEIQHTVHTFLKNNLNIAETARQLHMHRNTLVYRIEQLEKSLGMDIKTIDGAIHFRICTMVANYLNFIKGNLYE